MRRPRVAPAKSLMVGVCSSVTVLEGLDQAIINGEVSAGDVAGPVAGQQQGEVSDLLGSGEASGDRSGRRVCRDVTRFHAGGLGNRLSNAVVA